MDTWEGFFRVILKFNNHSKYLNQSHMNGSSVPQQVVKFFLVLLAWKGLADSSVLGPRWCIWIFNMLSLKYLWYMGKKCSKDSWNGHLELEREFRNEDLSLSHWHSDGKVDCINGRRIQREKKEDKSLGDPYKGRGAGGPRRGSSVFYIQ